MLIPRGTVKTLYNNDKDLLKLLEIHSKAIIALQETVKQQQEEIKKLKAVQNESKN